MIAIDLGTSCTAFSWRAKKDTAVTVGVPDETESQYDTGKTPTSLLVKGSWKDEGADRVFEHERVEAFGKDAERRLRESSNASGELQLFKEFKMVRREYPCGEVNYSILSRRCSVLQYAFLSIAGYYCCRGFDVGWSWPARTRHGITLAEKVGVLICSAGTR